MNNDICGTPTITTSLVLTESVRRARQQISRETNLSKAEMLAGAGGGGGHGASIHETSHQASVHPPQDDVANVRPQRT